MPKISLVVCLYRERDLLERLLRHAEGCYDELIVVHDGPESHQAELNDVNSGIFVPSHRHPELAVDFSSNEDGNETNLLWRELEGTPKPGSIHEVVAKRGGRFFEGPRCWQQEPHWPFAWSKATHGWILKMDADEYPSDEMARWIQEFRLADEPAVEISGFTCIWPLWNGRSSVLSKWPEGRHLLFNKNRIRFVGLVEMVPFTETKMVPLDLSLNHTPKRKSYGYRNILFRKQAYTWRRVIALSLLGTPNQLPRWRWAGNEWPQPFERIRTHPLRYFVECIFICPRYGLKNLLKNRMWSILYSFPGSHWHHALICLDFFFLKRMRRPATG